MLGAVQHTIENQESSTSGVTEHESAVKPAVSTALARFGKGFALAIAVIAGVSATSSPTEAGAPVADNTNIMTAGPRGPTLLQDVWLIEKLAHFDREVIPERRMHAKGWGVHGTFTVTQDITPFTKAKIFSAIGKQTPMFARFSTVAGERMRGGPLQPLRRR
jgi:hypothetical protein